MADPLPATADSPPAERPGPRPEPEREPLLSRPPEEGARRLALAFLDQAAQARSRLRGGDGEALHDFRVGLRRLRSCLRAYRGPLGGGISRKLERRLARLADATGAGRDAEVQIEWLRAQAPVLGGYQRAGLRWLLDRLEVRRDGAYRHLEDDVVARFDNLEAELGERLSVYTAEVRLDGRSEARDTLGGATAAILVRDLGKVGERLAAIDGPGDVAHAHRARIAAKRLRYLLEPLADELLPVQPAAKPLVKKIKELQDLLGELHDAHVLERELDDALTAAAAERAAALFAATLATVPDAKLLRAERRRSRESAILALARLNRERRDRLYAELAGGWLEGRADTFLAGVAGLGDALAPA